MVAEKEKEREKLRFIIILVLQQLSDSKIQALSKRSALFKVGVMDYFLKSYM